MDIKQIKQSELSSECFMVQIFGFDTCLTCEYKNTDECGGKEVRKSQVNSKGYDVPLKNQESI